MSIDDRLREGLPVALEHVEPDLDADLALLMKRAASRRTKRRLWAVTALVAAAAAVAVGVYLAPRSSQEPDPVEPIAPRSDVRVLDGGRGNALNPAPLEPARYAIPFIGSDDGDPWGEVQVPAGWGQDRLLLATAHDLDPHLRRLELLGVDSVALDPCRGVPHSVAGGTDAVVAALTRQRVVRPVVVDPASIDGIPADVVRFRVPSGLDVARCVDGESLWPFGSAGGHTSVFPGWTYDVYVLAVGGGPKAILAAHGPAASPAEVAELDAMVRGLRLVPPPR